ncbi:hypothetical protein D3C81_2287350 [compost metagenome]
MSNSIVVIWPGASLQLCGTLTLPVMVTPAIGEVTVAFGAVSPKTSSSWVLEMTLTPTKGRSIIR